MEAQLDRMNGVLMDWKTKFDLFSSVKMNFFINKDKRLCLNNNPIHLPEGLTLSSAFFDAENITFSFYETERILNIGIAWPEDESPYVDTTRFGYASTM